MGGSTWPRPLSAGIAGRGIEGKKDQPDNPWRCLSKARRINGKGCAIGKVDMDGHLGIYH